MNKIKNLLTNENVTKGFNAIKKVAKEGVKLAAPIASMVLISKASGRITDDLCNNGIVWYDDAVKAILNSNMWSEDKTTAISALKRGKDSAFYSAIIEVAKSSMFSADKLKTILSINEH